MGKSRAAWRLLASQGATALLLVSCTASASPSVTPGASAEATSLGTASPSAAPSPRPISWRELPASGAAPAPREDHTWTVDAAGEIAYLFGGRDDASGHGSYADLWAYDLATDTWQQLSGGPPARFGHNAAWVPGMGLVVFAGQDVAFFNDLWAYDPATDTWRVLPPNGAAPVPRYGSCAALGPDGRLWISHGFTSEGSRFSDTRAYDFSTETWTDETPGGAAPVERCLHGCWWTDDGHFTLYAGQTTGSAALGDLWQLTVGPRPGTNTWAQVTADLPPARNLYAFARSSDQATTVFGGQGPNAEYLNDLWLFADATAGGLPLSAAGSPPPARSGAELVADLERGRLLLFGGKAGASVFGDLWELTLP
jgi:hypothetical protein